MSIFDDYKEDVESYGITDTENQFKNLIIGFSQVQGRSKSVYKNGFEVIKKPHVKDVLPLLYDEEDNRFQELSDWIIGLHGESLKNAQPTKEAKVLDFVFEVISDIIGEQVTFENADHLDKILWVKVNNHTPVPFHLISQGFKNIFAWIGHFMKRLAEANNYVAEFMNAPAIVLIDEIDTYLHPKWQINMLRVLAEKFPNTQFIVSTHAPLMANHLPTESKAVYIVKENEILEVPHIYGKEISSIYYNWMGVKSRPTEIQQKIDELFVALDKEDTVEAKKIYTILEHDIGAEDGDLIEAKAYMELIENQD